MGACLAAPRSHFIRELRTIASPRDIFVKGGNGAVAKLVFATLNIAIDIVTSLALLRAPIFPIVA